MTNNSGNKVESRDRKPSCYYVSDPLPPAITICDISPTPKLDRNVDVRTFGPVENFYKHLSESNGGYAWKLDLNRMRKMLPRNDSLQFSSLQLSKEDDRIAGWVKSCVPPRVVTV